MSFISDKINKNANEQWFWRYMGNNEYNGQPIRFGLGDYFYNALDVSHMFSDTAAFINNIEKTYQTEKIKIEHYLSLCKYHNNDWQPSFDSQDEYDEYSDIFGGIANYEDTYVRNESELRMKKIQWMNRFTTAYMYSLKFAKQLIKYKPKIITAITLNYFTGDYKENASEILEFCQEVKDVYPLSRSYHNIIRGYFERTEDTGFWREVENILPKDWKE